MVIGPGGFRAYFDAPGNPPGRSQRIPAGFNAGGKP